MQLVSPGLCQFADGTGEPKKAKTRSSLSLTYPPRFTQSYDRGGSYDQSALPPLTAAGWTVQLVVKEKTLLRPASVFTHSSKAYTAHYDVQQLTPGLRFAVVWHDGRPNPAPSVGTCWIQQGGAQSPTTLIGSSLLVPDQQRWASLASKIETGTGPLKFTLVVRDPVQPGAQPAEPIASFVLLCNFPPPPPAAAQAQAPSPPVQAVPPVRTTLPERTVSGALYDPQTEQRAYRSLQDSYYQALARADYFEKTVATLYRHLTPSAHLRYLDSRLSEDALAPALRASVAETREHVVEHLRRETASAVQTEFFDLMSALEEENPVPDANASLNETSWGGI